MLPADCDRTTVKTLTAPHQSIFYHQCADKSSPTHGHRNLCASRPFCHKFLNSYANAGNGRHFQAVIKI